MTQTRTGLTPVFKWTGGKRRELPRIRPHLPDYVTGGSDYRYVEPFAGGAALYWDLDNHTGSNALGDFDPEVMNFYRVMADQDPDFLTYVADTAKLYTSSDHAAQEANYYRWRNMDRAGLNSLSDAERAARFWIVGQLAFSGMRRFNSSGHFNVPYGHYKTLNASALSDPARVRLLGATTFHTGDYADLLDVVDDPGTFVFIDPPYTRVMKTYSAGNSFGEDDQWALAERLKDLDHADWMVVINRDDLTEELYDGYIRDVYPLRYGANIRNRFDRQVEHILATNRPW